MTFTIPAVAIAHMYFITQNIKGTYQKILFKNCSNK